MDNSFWDKGETLMYFIGIGYSYILWGWDLYVLYEGVGHSSGENKLSKSYHFKVTFIIFHKKITLYVNDMQTVKERISKKKKLKN